MKQMEITDMVIRSHIVSVGKFTDEQLKTVNDLIKSNPTFDNIVQLLESNEHEIIHQHSNDLEIDNIKTIAINEDDEDFLSALEKAVSKFNQSKQQPNNEKI